VIQVIDGSPETATRSIRILENAGISSTEAEMTRVTRVFQFLSQNGFPWMATPARQMTTRWKQMQVDKTVQRIRECGIEIKSFGDEFSGLVFVDSGVREATTAAEPVPQSKTFERPNREQLVSGIEIILNASEEELHAQLRDAIVDASDSEDSPGDMPLAAPNGFRGRVIVDGRLLVLDEADNRFQQAVIAADTSDMSEGLRLMRLLPSLYHIEFREREISESDVEALAGITGLQVITLTRCRYEAGHLLKFMATHPGINFSASGHDAFLGVSLQSDYYADPFNPAAEGDANELKQICRVLTVVPDTAAADAGLEEGDGILEVNDIPLATFNQLIVIIASRSPGDELKLKILHDDEVREETVTLRQRPVGQ
jgi:hypothetical protein